MPQAIVYLDVELNIKVKDYMERNKIEKADALIELIKKGLEVKQ